MELWYLLKFIISKLCALFIIPHVNHQSAFSLLFALASSNSACVQKHSSNNKFKIFVDMLFRVLGMIDKPPPIWSTEIAALNMIVRCLPAFSLPSRCSATGKS